MLNVERDIVNRSNEFTANEIENRRLEQLHTQLENFNLQATIIIGFALSTINADNLVALSDDVSKFCLYKQPGFALAYAVLTFGSIATCMTCIGISFYVIARSQQTANEVSVHHCVALVRRLKSLIMAAYFAGVTAFFTSLIVLCWMYIGNPNWRRLEGPPGSSGTRWATGYSNKPNSTQYCNAETAPGLTGNPACDSYIANGWDAPVLQDSEGEMLVTCFNPYNATQQAQQRDIGFNVALGLTLSFCLVAFLGFCAWVYVRGQFRRLEAIITTEKKQPAILHSTELLERVTPASDNCSNTQ